jgi:hypothetical protein
MLVTQEWVATLSMMQQTVLLTAVRGPDGISKYTNVKMLLRWYRRCLLLSAVDRKVLTNPYDSRGGSFTGPSYTEGDPRWPADWRASMATIVDNYLRELDAIPIPHHFHMHLMHAIEIMGYKHPTLEVRAWWHSVYLRFVNDMHVRPETEEDLDRRLGDTREGWLEAADPATTA